MKTNKCKNCKHKKEEHNKKFCWHKSWLRFLFFATELITKTKKFTYRCRCSGFE